MAPFPALTLTYFHAAGRAEASRLALYIGGVPFVDKRLTAEQFGAIKSSLPLGQAPTLEVDGQVMTQSQAILRFAGRLGGLYPVSSPFAALKVDEIVHVLDELAEQMGPAFREQDADKKKVMREELASVTIPNYATKIEARLEAMQKMPIFQSDAVFIHHVAIYAWVKSLRAGYIDHIPTSVVSPFKLINAIHDRIAGHPKVQEWYSLPHTPTPKLKLTYFPVPGRAEPIRLALFMAGIPFEDHRVPFEEWPTIKSTMPFDCIPVLEVDGEVIAQSLAITRYVGSLSGLYPTVDPVEALRVDELFAIIDEMYNAPSHRAVIAERDFAKKEELAGVAASTVYTKTFDFLNKRMAAWDAKFATGEHLNAADLAIYTLVVNFSSGRYKTVPASILDPYTHLKRVHDLVSKHPKVAEWNAAKQ